MGSIETRKKRCIDIGVSKFVTINPSGTFCRQYLEVASVCQAATYRDSSIVPALLPGAAVPVSITTPVPGPSQRRLLGRRLALPMFV